MIPKPLNLFETMTVVIPAAGYSRRVLRTAGIPKILFPLAGQPWLHWQLKAVEKAGISRAVLVLGYHYERLVEECPWLRFPFSLGGLQVSPVRNPVPQEGPFSSLQTALRFLRNSDRKEVVLINPIDVPFPDGPLCLKLSKLTGSILAAIPVHAGHRGHPVALHESFWKKLSCLPPDDPDARLDRQLTSLPRGKTRIVPTKSKNVLMNLNSSADFLGFLQSCPQYFRRPPEGPSLSI